jgi:hypothetical protein
MNKKSLQIFLFSWEQLRKYSLHFLPSPFKAAFSCENGLALRMYKFVICNKFAPF